MTARAEGPLLQLLDGCMVSAVWGPTGLRIPVIRALGKVGSPRALEVLRRLPKGVLADAGLVSSARAAIAQIEGRVGALGGQVAVVGEIGGEVDLASDAGAVSVAEGGPRLTTRS